MEQVETEDSCQEQLVVRVCDSDSVGVVEKCGGKGNVGEGKEWRLARRGAAKLLSNSLQVLKIGKELENKINWKLLFLSVSKIISTL